MQKNEPMMKALFSSLLAMVLLGCQGEPRETPTKGELSMIVAESVAPMIKQEQDTFQSVYQRAHVHIQVASSREAVAQLMNDSVTVIVSSRALNEEEQAVQKKANLTIKEYKIAIDGVAIIVNSDNPVTQMRTTQLDSVFNGAIHSWLSVGGKRDEIELCLPSRNTGIFEVVQSKLLHGGSFAKPVAVARTSPEMIQFVSQHPHAIGMVGLNWMPDTNGSVRSLELADPNAPDSLGTRGKYFGPHPAYVYQRYYPLSHEIYIYSRADNYGVGAGFISFITSAAGQKIVLKSGLVPATMPVRLVQITKKSI